METVRTIKLSGSLAQRFGREHRLAVNNPAEAVRALCAMKPGFEKFLMESKDRGLKFAVFTGSNNIREDELKNPVGQDVIRIIPVIMGSKRGGILQIIAGVVLVAVGVVVSGMEFAFGGITAGQIGAYIAGMGISMIVGGVVQMLTPIPKNQGKEIDDRRSYLFNGAVNVSAQGASVPLLYGEMYVGSVVGSAGISVEDNYITPSGGEKEVGGGKYRDGGLMVGDVIARAKGDLS